MTSSTLAGCGGPSPEELESVDYSPLAVGDWQISTPEEQGLDPDLVAELYYNASELETIYSLLVFKNGYLIAEDYFHIGSAGQRVNIHSVTKSINSVLVGMALDQGCLSSLDQKMMGSFPELADRIAELGAVAADYVRAGEGLFLSGWLLPHGVIEIPAIVIAGQAGLLLAGALLDRSGGLTLGQRMASISSDVVTLIGCVALMLVWAGIIEAFFSQYHAPIIPYSIKIIFGIIELSALTVYLTWAGRGDYHPKGGYHRLNLAPLSTLVRRLRR